MVIREQTLGLILMVYACTLKGYIRHVEEQYRYDTTVRAKQNAHRRAHDRRHERDHGIAYNSVMCIEKILLYRPIDITEIVWLTTVVV